MRSDIELKRMVEEELRWEPRVNAAGIGVAVEDGVVTLTGYVDSWAEKWGAERAVKRVPGVAAVAEAVEVRLPVHSRRTDAEIARAAANALAWNAFVPLDAVKVRVENAWVTLEGVVTAPHEKSAAGEAVRRLIGVRGVTNLVSLRTEVAAANVKDGIRSAFERSAALDASRVAVDVAPDDTVVLRGTVRSWGEREDAESAAWSAPGIAGVDNRIVVAR